ncbi:ATP-binding protein [Bacillus sp. RAR_GA_16]|uniref:ATP-binding protein n=1 Tax=Bacillus sp. RAR_GA_16 TaxID=2876774 RepID=UPI001CCD2000|nr:ATP-binding protein [Bacillus sp. RAR_GA_16]MCA0173175.1 PAS domain S-box protein [Bacillus sp. RAR_GA_16]
MKCTFINPKPPASMTIKWIPNSIPVLQVLLSEEELTQQLQKYERPLSIIQKFMTKLLSFLSETPTVIVTTDNKGFVLDSYGDERLKQMTASLGVQNGVRFNEEKAGTNAITLALKHDQPFYLIGDDHYHHCFSEVACYSAPYRYQNGQVIGTISIMTPKEYASPLYLGMLSSSIDTIEREIQVHEQNDQLHLYNQMLMNATPIGIVISDEAGQIREFNTSAAQLTGLNKSNMVGRHISDIPVLKPFFDHVLTRKKGIEDIEIIFSTHVERKCLLDILPLYHHDQLSGAFAQFRDMTSYYQLQDQVIQSEKLSAIGKLGAGLAHEIRNPLTSIIGFTQLLDVDEKQSHYIDIITTELERMKNLVNQFVMMGKQTSSERKLGYLNPIIEETVELMRSNAHLHNVEIHFHSIEEQMMVWMDSSQMKQVLINFIKNAIEAMPGGGNITVDLTKKDNKAIISIKDTGDGMSEKEVNQLGTPFFSTKSSGLGIGLSICFDIMQAHQGNIVIDSEKGVGTNAKLLLPLHTQEY